MSLTCFVLPRWSLSLYVFSLRSSRMPAATADLQQQHQTNGNEQVELLDRSRTAAINDSAWACLREPAKRACLLTYH